MTPWTGQGVNKITCRRTRWDRSCSARVDHPLPAPSSSRTTRSRTGSRLWTSAPCASASCGTSREPACPRRTAARHTRWERHTCQRAWKSRPWEETPGIKKNTHTHMPGSLECWKCSNCAEPAQIVLKNAQIVLNKVLRYAEHAQTVLNMLNYAETCSKLRWTCYKLCSKCSNWGTAQAHGGGRTTVAGRFSLVACREHNLWAFCLPHEKACMHAKKAFANSRRPTTAQKRPYFHRASSFNISHIKVLALLVTHILRI